MAGRCLGVGVTKLPGVAGMELKAQKLIPEIERMMEARVGIEPTHKGLADLDVVPIEHSSCPLIRDVPKRYFFRAHDPRELSRLFLSPKQRDLTVSSHLGTNLSRLG